MMQSKQTGPVLMILGLLLIASVGYILWQQSRPQPQVACDTVAKLCPDGSSVGRSGPNCDFAPCPVDTATTTPPTTPVGWLTTSTPSGISYNYPKDLATTYIHTADWPPKVQVVPQAFTCTETGSEILPTGKTTKVTIGTTTYCVTQKAEGAAGSTYTQYTYALARGTQTVNFTFTLRTPQCANYDEPQKTACTTEQADFNLNSIVDRIAQTLK